LRTPDTSFGAVINAYKRKHSLTEDERRFLDRLRDDSVGFEPHPGNAHLVERLIIAWQVANGMMKMREADRRLDKEVEEVRRLARALRGIGIPLSGGPFRLKHGFAFLDERKRALSYEAIEVASDLPDHQPFPRFTRQPSKQNLFLAQVCTAMMEIFGDWRDKDVAHLCDLAFETDKPVNPQRVRSIHRNAANSATKKKLS
jgi:hypothetical protein